MRLKRGETWRLSASRARKMVTALALMRLITVGRTNVRCGECCCVGVIAAIELFGAESDAQMGVCAGADIAMIFR